MTGTAHWRESTIITEASMDIHEEIDLQECPYCGGAGLLEEEHGWYVICVDCGSQTASIDFQTSDERLESAHKAAHLWNIGKILRSNAGD